MPSAHFPSTISTGPDIPSHVPHPRVRLGRISCTVSLCFSCYARGGPWASKDDSRSLKLQERGSRRLRCLVSWRDITNLFCLLSGILLKRHCTWWLSLIGKAFASLTLLPKLPTSRWPFSTSREGGADECAAVVSYSERQNVLS